MSDPTTPTATRTAPLHGLLAEYDSPKAILHAAEKVREAGFSRWDTFTPYPVHGIERAMGIQMTILPWIVLGAGPTGCVGALTMQWWMNAVDYPIIISGKPFNSLPADIPVIFELTVLLASLTAFIGMLAFNALPRFNHPLFKQGAFRRVTNDAFFLVIEAADPRFEREKTEQFLVQERATGVFFVED